MYNATKKVVEFHQKFGQPVRTEPKWVDPAEDRLAGDLIEEEMNELWAAMSAKDLAKTADAIADLIYVLLGLAIRLGVDIVDVFEGVHAANMRKEGGGTRADGKILKPEGWEAPAVQNLMWGPNLLVLTNNLDAVQSAIVAQCDAVKRLLLQKNKEYGNSFAQPINVFSTLSAEDQINILIDIKLKRLQNLRRLATVTIQEDTEQDLIGYLVLKRVIKALSA